MYLTEYAILYVYYRFKHFQYKHQICHNTQLDAPRLVQSTSTLRRDHHGRAWSLGGKIDNNFTSTCPQNFFITRCPDPGAGWDIGVIAQTCIGRVRAKHVGQTRLPDRCRRVALVPACLHGQRGRESRIAYPILP